MEGYDTETFAHMAEELCHSAEKSPVDNDAAADILEQWAEALRNNEVSHSTGLPSEQSVDGLAAAQD